MSAGRIASRDDVMDPLWSIEDIAAALGWLLPRSQFGLLFFRLGRPNRSRDTLKVTTYGFDVGLDLGNVLSDEVHRCGDLAGIHLNVCDAIAQHETSGEINGDDGHKDGHNVPAVHFSQLCPDRRSVWVFSSLRIVASILARRASN